MFPYMSLTGSVDVWCTVKLESDLMLVYAKCGSNAFFTMVYSHEPLVIITIVTVVGL